MKSKKLFIGSMFIVALFILGCLTEEPIEDRTDTEVSKIDESLDEIEDSGTMSDDNEEIEISEVSEEDLEGSDEEEDGFSDVMEKNSENESVDLEEPVSDGIHKISVKSLLFEPSEINIKVGEKVQWVHEDDYNGRDDIKHKITIYNVGYSPILVLGDSFEHTFEKTGKFSFVDSIYTDMRGTIIVEE